MTWKILLMIVALTALAMPAAAQTVPATGAPATGAAGTAPSVEEINAMRAGLIDAFNKRDVDKLVTFLHPDIVVTWQSGEVTHGIDELKRYYSRMMSGENSVVESVTADPQVDGRTIVDNMAISFGHMNDSFKMRNGMEFRLDSRFSAWVVKDGDRWVLRGLHLSGNIFDNEIQTAVLRRTMLASGGLTGLAGLIAGWMIGRWMGRKKAAA